MEAQHRDTVTGKERRRFYAALALFLFWVAALGAMAVLSGRRPAANPSAIEGRQRKAPMPWPWTPSRRDAPELMDAPGLPEAEVAEAYRVLRRVNQQLGNLRSVRREVDRLLSEDGPWTLGEGVTVLDVGSGSGDIPRSLVDQLPGGATVLSLDRDPTAVALARRSGLNVIQGDALRLPFADASLDLVTAVKFAHHFSGPGLTRLLAEMARVARRRVVVLDIRRHWLAYYGFIAWSRVFTSNRLVRFDGPLSVLRGFTARELADLGEALPEFDWTVRGYSGFQLALVGRRLATTRRPGSEF